MASLQERAELDRRAKKGETIIPGVAGGKDLEEQEHLAQHPTIGREQLRKQEYKETGSREGQTTKESTRSKQTPEKATGEEFDIDESTG